MDPKRMTKADHPQSMGTFKPVGHVVMALRDDAQAARVVSALKSKGFVAEDILEYTAAEEANEMRSMLQYTSDFAGFGYEVTLMRRFKELAEQGVSWLIVYAPGDDATQRVAEVAKQEGALMAEKYNRLVIEDLVPTQ